MEQKSSLVVPHKPVLVHEVLTYLDPQPNKVYLDVTFGSGGHTRALLDYEPRCRVIALDWDMDAIERFAPPIVEQYGDRFSIIWGSFAHLYKIARKEKIKEVAGILADFGTSQVQLTHKEGFSFIHDTPLDMRMSHAHYKLTARDIINDLSQPALRDIFWDLGEERYARQIAQAIVEERKKYAIKTTVQLAKIVERVKPVTPGRRIHPATKVFQALRMYVNQEVENINSFLPAAVNLLGDHGRLACISFHSIEDRMVKQFFKEQQQLGNLDILTKKAVMATEEEIETNRSSRSACLRVAQRILTA